MADIYGGHRVVSPPGVLPQAADRLNPALPLEANEILIQVSALQPTATAFGRIRQACGSDPAQMAAYIKDLVARQGKFQDPETRSGGILTGCVARIGTDLAGRTDLAEGDPVATLVSLSLTPLILEKIHHIDMRTEQVRVTGTAILFESGIYARLPEDLPQGLAMAALDVAGAPAMVRMNVVPGQVVAVLGAGKAGLLCLAEAMERVWPHGRVVCLEYDPDTCARVKSLGLAHEVIRADARKPLETLAAWHKVMGTGLADFTVNCVNVGDTETTSALVTRNSGQVYFFSMSTHFAKASLGAEGVGRHVRMLIGNGYTPGHTEITFQILRRHNRLRHYFEATFAAGAPGQTPGPAAISD